MPSTLHCKSKLVIGKGLGIRRVRRHLEDILEYHKADDESTFYIISVLLYGKEFAAHAL